MGNAASADDALGADLLRVAGLGDAVTELTLRVDDAALQALHLAPGSCEEARAVAARRAWRACRKRSPCGAGAGAVTTVRGRQDHTGSLTRFAGHRC